MISSLRGKLIHKDAESVVVECAGVGYGASMSLSSLTRLGHEGDGVFLFVHTHLSQDALRLFGFIDQAERATFRVLVATSGVGPKLALAILSTLSAGELAEVVQNADKAMLRRIPGVGPKKADRLLIELKDRLPKGEVGAGHKAVSMVSDLAGDLVSALLNLGFKPKDAEAALKALLANNGKVKIPPAPAKGK